MNSLNSRIVEMVLAVKKDSMIVSDPDRLIDQEIAEELSERSYSVIEFEDSVVFRFLYESEFRDKEKRLLVVTRDVPPQELPFDISSSLLAAEVSLNSVFPKLSRNALERLEKRDLQKLHEAYSDSLQPLSTRGTREFVLKCIYEFDPEKRYDLSGLVAWLMQLHYKRLQLRGELLDLVIDIAREKGYEKLLDLPTLVRHRESFFEFLQERWPVFLKNHGKFISYEEGDASLKHKGPGSLPFDDPKIKVYVDTMFAEGLLKAVPVDDPSKYEKSWMAIGIDGAGSERIRFKKLFEIVSNSIPESDANYSNWIDFAWRWAELNLVAYSISQESEDHEGLEAIKTLLDSKFENWMVEEYGRLLTISSKLPVTVKDILSWIGRSFRETGKTALVVIDGMSLLQWSKLSHRLNGFLLEQQATFAMIPTVTAVSRQAIFSGSLPSELSGLKNTSAEAGLWRRAWMDKGVKEREISYINRADNQLMRAVKESIEREASVIGIVIRELDEKAHGENIGMRSLLAATEIWLQESCFLDLCKLLLWSGYEVILTSDHGNVESKGIGNPAEGLMAETRGERVRIYKDSLLRHKIHSEYPDSIEWISAGLPQDFLPLIARGRRAFTTLDSAVISHGGLTLDEVIVPLIRLSRG